MKRLEIGTFKAISGMKISERFLKIAFDRAISLGVNEIYTTIAEPIDTEKAKLISILEKWGFNRYGIKNEISKKRKEIVMVKSMTYDYNKNPIYNYPNIKEKVNYYFLPIKHEYHTDLFPDLILKNEDSRIYNDDKSHRFALEKIYLTNLKFNTINQLKNIKPGDILFIYRMGGERNPKKYSSVISGTAIFNDIKKIYNKSEFIEICRKRTVFSDEEIINWYNKKATIISLISYQIFNNKVTLSRLQDEKIVQQGEGPRIFDKISEKDAIKILSIGGLK